MTMEPISLYSPLFAIVLIFLGAFTFVTWKKTIYGIYLITLLLPSYLIRLRIGPFPTTVLELMVLLLTILWLKKNNRWKRIHFFWKREKRVMNAIPATFRWPCIIILIAAFIGTLASPDQQHALGILKAYFIEPMLLLIISAYTIQEKRELETIVSILGALVLGLSCIAIIQYFTGIGISNPIWADPAHRRVTTLFGYPNASSLFIAPIVALYAGLIVNPRTPIYHRLYMLAVIVFGFCALLAAKTAGAIIAVLIIGWLLLVRYQATRTIAIALVIILLTLGAHRISVDPHYAEVLQSVMTNRLDLESTSFEIRVNQWRETAALLADHPFFGGGLAGYQQALTPYHRYAWLEKYLYPHTLVFNFWTELGITGLIGIVWLFAAIGARLWNCHKQSKPDSNESIWAFAFMLSWTALIIHGSVDVPYFKNDLSMEFMILLALTIGIPLLHKKSAVTF